MCNGRENETKIDISSRVEHHEIYISNFNHRYAKA